MSYSTKKNLDVSEVNGFRQTIEQNYVNEVHEILDAKTDKNTNTIIVKINLCRAVIEDVAFFKDFTNYLLNPNIKHYILDFSDTIFLDSTFLGSIIIFLKKIKLSRGTLSLVINCDKITILSQIKSLLKDGEFSITEYVKTDEDTELIIDRCYEGGIHGEVKIISKLKFYAGTIKQNTYITMTVDDVNGTISFDPSMKFNKDVELYVKFEGLDLGDLSEEYIDFVYLANDGSV
jgi:anti-anti-sigma regulatory factor